MARALIRDASIILLDEPTAALDTESERFVQDAMGKLIKGRTTLVIAHRLHTIAQADMIHVVEKGTIVEIRPPHRASGALRPLCAFPPDALLAGFGREHERGLGRAGMSCLLPHRLPVSGGEAEECPLSEFARAIYHLTIRGRLWSEVEWSPQRRTWCVRDGAGTVSPMANTSTVRTLGDAPARPRQHRGPIRMVPFNRSTSRAKATTM
jgi:energy-coupling factor transporter ATP-binding protein EcfA2